VDRLRHARHHVHLGVEVAVEVFEAAFVRVVGLLRVSEVPLPHQRGLVTGGLEALGHEVFVGVDAVVCQGRMTP